MDVLALLPGERILIVGVGTGADLPILPASVDGVALDLSAEMLTHARSKLVTCPATIQLVQADAQTRVVGEALVDVAILNLILSVVPDGRACLRIALDAVKPGGRVVVFDKFQPDAQEISQLRRFLNVFSTWLGTDITRRFGDLVAGAPCQIVADDPGLLGGVYRVILLHKATAAGQTSVSGLDRADG